MIISFLSCSRYVDQSVAQVVEEVRDPDAPVAEPDKVILDFYNSDLNLSISRDGLVERYLLVGMTCNIFVLYAISLFHDRIRFYTCNKHGVKYHSTKLTRICS